MARIVSISYDEHLLRTRELLLKAAGHHVKSALGYQKALELCAAERFDVAIIGHSIPTQHKLAIIECFRKASPGAAVIALTRRGEEPLNEADYYADPWKYGELVHSVARMTNTGAGHRPDTE